MTMRRRFYLMLALLAGCSTPVQPASLVAPAPAPAPLTEAVPPPPAPPVSVAPPAATGDIRFDTWAGEFQGRALAAGITPEVLAREMAGLSWDQRVANLDNRQPEFSRPVSDYIKGVVTADRAAVGRRRAAEIAAFDAIEQRFGVPREVLLAVWAMESAFGQIQGDYDTVRSLATLAAEGRRRDWAEGELIAALKIIQTGEQPREKLKGSWAGAMGQTQFTPSTYLALAIDQDGDGKRDIWSSAPDALASAANHLARDGWVRGQSWAREVIVPEGFDYSLTEGPRETPLWWAERGLKRADGLPWTETDQAAKAQLVAPAGATGPKFLLFPNHFAIRKYNNSLAYALGIGMLADRFSGGGQLVTAWPAEQPLSLVDRMTAQRALAALGFDPGAPDGVVGMGTRTALRAWQKARGLTADGYLSAEMVQKLKTEAGS